MTKKIKFLEDCIFQRDLIYKKDKLYAIKYEDNTHYIVPDEFDNENELSKVCSIFDYEITEEPKVTKYIKLTLSEDPAITLNRWYKVYEEYRDYYTFFSNADDPICVPKTEPNYVISEGHPHKHLIKKAAELAEVTMNVGSHFQWKGSDGEWETMSAGIAFLPNYEYRLKPRTIKIGNREINAPEREAPNEGQTYYIPYFCVFNVKYSTYVWRENDFNMKYHLENGLVFLTKEDAIAAAEAMIELLRGDA